MAESKSKSLGCGGILVLALLATAAQRSCGQATADGRAEADQRAAQAIAEANEESRKAAAERSAARARAPAIPEPRRAAQQAWYEGGTLHDAGALEWQNADPRNKLATAAALLAKLWLSKKLKPKVAIRIHDVDDLMGPSAELVEALNRALEKQADPKLNRQIYTNQKVSEIAALLLVMMGWV
jgi:hypothetical protein